MDRGKHHRELIFIHRENHALQVNIHALRKRSHTLQEKINALCKSHVLRKRDHAWPDKKIVHLKRNIYPSTSIASFIWGDRMPRESWKTT